MNLKNISLWDVSLTKLSVFSATLFLVSVWHGFADWAMSTHWTWFLVVSLLLAIKPVMTVFKK